MTLLPSSSSSSSSSPSSSFKRWKFDVFLSFRGKDTRKSFTDHLHTALEQKGISVFRDNEKLKQGTFIAPELLKAIEKSRFAVVILSRDYASSKWCLNELTKIVECMEMTGLIVLPVFHYVDPSDVRNLRKTFGDAFAKHEESFKDNTGHVQTWKDALTKVANLAGWELKDEYESTIIKKIIGRIFSELYHKLPCISEDLVGIDSCVEEMLDSYIGEGLGGVRFVGICGMGGVGKTTLAREIYRRISGNFDDRCFIANIRENTKNQGLVSLQKKLLSKILILAESEINICDVCEGINFIRNTLCNKNVLIILDDVDGEKQLEALAGKHDWFGPGSRIIVTSRDSHLLKICEDYIYTAKELNNDDALQLFSWKAFHKPHPEENYVNLSKDVVNYVKGLPLALKVLGSSLFTKELDEWKSALYKLKEEPNREILDVLKISFDGLTDSQKGLFLDIACFFKGKNKDCIRDILKSFRYHPDYNIGVLMDKSLISIDDRGTLGMHDLLQDMGQEIVCRESPKEPGGRSRLWVYDDVIHVLKNNTGTEVVEGIMLNMSIQEVEHLSAKVFSKMKFLRLLIINNMKFPEDFINGTMKLRKVLIGGNVQLLKDLSYLSDELRIIEWHGYPFKSMPTSLQPNKLVELRMHCSRIIQLWKGIMILDALKLVDLSGSQYLIETPDLSGAPKLKQLILRHCTRLYKIHTSLGDLKQLIRLDLHGCKRLEILPHKISLEALEIFDLGGCSRLKKFPEIVGNMSRLSKLCLSETTIKDLPLLVEFLTGLIELDLRDCKNLSSLSNACCCLMSLKILNLSGCSKLDELPENLGNVEGLEKFDVSGTAITGLPLSVVNLKNLEVLSLRGCVGLSSKSVNKLLSFSLMQRRRSLDPMGMLECSLQGLWSLKELDLSYCNIQKIPDFLGSLSSLITLNLKGNNFVCLPESIIQLSNLEYLLLSGCTQLQMLPKLPLNMDFVDATGCTSLETLSLSPDYDFLPYVIFLQNCVKLIYNQGKGDLLSTILRHYIVKRCNDSGRFTYLRIPGSEVPNWFRHQNVGDSVNLQVPSHLLLSSKFMGITVCAVYIVNQRHPLQNHSLYCSIKANGKEGFSINEGIDKIESCHLWFEYFPYKTRFESKWKEELDANEFTQIEVTFKPEGLGLEVTKCGAHLIFEQDFEDLNQTKPGSSSCIITPYYEDDDLGESEKDTKIKESRDDEPPHPKWTEQPNLIENWIGNSCI